ncbi:MAG: Phosphopantetheine attachment site [Clostridiales bacterium]|nr:Phosphopantetheine attachment site [Clostridiales bacterium]
MSTREQIKQKLIERGAPLFGKNPEEITEDMKFVEDLAAKSVHYSQITTYLEDEFDVEIPYMTFRRKATIGEAVDYVLELVENE